MSEYLKLQIAVLIKNTMCLALWVVLAIVFNKWWIALFGALFITSVTSKDKNEEELLNESKR